MKALLCRSFGRLEDLRVQEVGEPKVRNGQVLVRVQACGLNFPDVLIVQGKYQGQPELPYTPASEFSGLVEAVGDGVTGFAVGDRVCGTVDNGALAEKVVASVRRVSHIPAGVDMDAAAALLTTYSTSLHALRDRAALQPGESVLVLGAGGGVGLAAVEIAKVLGAKVVAAASSEEKLSLARGRGADSTLHYPGALDARADQKAFSAQLKEHAGRDGFDVIYDPVGGPYSDPAFRAIAWQGRYLVVGFAAGAIPALALNLPLLKGAQIVGVIWGNAKARDADAEPRMHRELLDLLAQGRIRPHVGQIIELQHSARGLKMLAERRALGKIIIRC